MVLDRSFDGVDSDRSLLWCLWMRDSSEALIWCAGDLSHLTSSIGRSLCLADDVNCVVI